MNFQSLKILNEISRLSWEVCSLTLFFQDTLNSEEWGQIVLHGSYILAFQNPKPLSIYQWLESTNSSYTL